MKIRISHYSFSISEPFRPGHVLSENEADALNALRAENIRNNVKRWVDDATKYLSEGEILPPEAINQLQERVSAYASEYEFGTKREPKGGIRKTAFEIELHSIAQERIESQLRTMDISLSDEALEQAIEEQMKLAPVIEEARQRVAKRQVLSKEALQGLLE